MDKSQLTKILIINDLKRETIFDVVGRMKVLLEFFKRNKKYKNLAPFLKTYYLVTKSVAERRVEHKSYFSNPAAMDHLDVYFADLYFRPLKAYLLRRALVKPWQTYFRYCEKKDGIPFVQMLLGINAHINSDLLTSVINLRYDDRKDFLVINKILKEEIPDVMKFLVKVDHDMYGLGALVFRDFALREFRNVIVHWRETVWKNSQKIDQRKYFQIKRGVLTQTEDIGREIIRIFENLPDISQTSKLLSKMNQLSTSLI